MNSRKCLIIILLVGLVISIFPAGCSSPAKKPVYPENTAIPDSPLNPSPDPTPHTPVIQISPKELVDQSVNQVCKIKGVHNAYAFVSDKIIYIGLDLGEDRNEVDSIAIEKEARNQIESLRSGYTVRVTSDDKTVELIKTVDQGLAQGQAFSDFNPEVQSVVLKMTPQGSRLINLPLQLYYILGYVPD